MKRTITAIVVAAAVFGAGAVEAKQKTIAGNWTLSVENLPLKLVLAQYGRAVTGTLDYPHGTPFRLTGAFEKDRLTFSGDSTGDDFTVHIQAVSLLNSCSTAGASYLVAPPASRRMSMQALSRSGERAYDAIT
jgi:hypothetical protein